MTVKDKPRLISITAARSKKDEFQYELVISETLCLLVIAIVSVKEILLIIRIKEKS